MRSSPAVERLERHLAKISDPSGEGIRTFLTLYPEAAYEAADAADRRARENTKLGPLDGTIVSIKDLFDVSGEPTRAGSTTLANAPPAARDATIIQRLRKAGAIIIGKTNMSEFAFTGVGANPHYGTPGNPADRLRVPGGSSSGAAVAVADGMCEIAIGTDTGGSTRIPAALCGVVGYKPTKFRVPAQGVFPLSPTLDSIGPIARNVEDCAAADTLLAGEQPWDLQPAELSDLRLGIPQGFPLDELDSIIAGRFEAAVTRLSEGGVPLTEMKFSIFEDMARVQPAATIATVEAYHIHRERIAQCGKAYDPIVRSRIESGSVVSEEDFSKMLQKRKELANDMDVRLAEVDALVLPTTPIVAPLFAELSSPKEFNAKNRLLLRNTAIANFFDLCAISLPMTGAGELPAGLMLVGRRGQDRRLFSIAASVEHLLCR